jgi:hypothetical protein
MRRFAPIALLAAALLAGCGSQTKTVTAASVPAPASSSSSSTAAPTTGPSTGSTATGTTATSGTPTTRSAPEPSFTEAEGEAKSGSLEAAVAAVRAHGYTPTSTAEYHPEQTLRVLVGTRSGSSDGYGQQAFFFLGGKYLGTDTKEPSATLKVVSQGDTEVAISYPLYRKGDPLCCPGAGSRVVHFVLNDGKLSALDPIPPASASSGPSRN